MNFLLQRYSATDESTQGLLFVKDPLIWICHTVEDQPQESKVKGETRIPAKYYELKIRKEDTQLTVKHRQTYGTWFKYHIEITGVDGFTGIYIHAGNNDDHTDGCVLLGDTIHNHKIEPVKMERSIQAVKRFYELCYPALESGTRCYLEIRDTLV